jgi:hypothetical protein
VSFKTRSLVAVRPADRHLKNGHAPLCVYTNPLAAGAACRAGEGTPTMWADELLNLLAGACPRFAPIWAEEVAWAEEHNAAPEYFPTIHELGRLLGALHRRGETACFPAVFAVFDRALAEGDDLAKALADELIDNLCSGNGTRRDPAHFEPYLGPIAAERWREFGRWYRSPDPRWEGVLALLVERNPARLTGDLRLEYRVATYYLPELLDRADSFELFRRTVWRYVQEHLPTDLDVPEDHYGEVARVLWDRWAGNARAAQPSQ